MTDTTLDEATLNLAKLAGTLSHHIDTAAYWLDKDKPGKAAIALDEAQQAVATWKDNR